MGTFGAYLEQMLLDSAFGKVAFTASTSLYIGLCTAAVNSTSTSISTEPSTLTGYTRVAVTNTTTNWDLAETSGAYSIKVNLGSLTFPVVAGSSWPNVAYAFVCDTSSNTNFAATATSTQSGLYAWGALTTDKDLAVGDTASFAAAAFKITLD